MKISWNWLQEVVDLSSYNISHICDVLTSLGFEVECIEDIGANLEPFKVAQVVSAMEHPQADKLRLCVVDNGAQQLQIVCGAPNARAGIKVVLAEVGAKIPASGIVIKSSNIRGCESNGMLCSAQELCIEDTFSCDEGGIIELPQSFVVGEKFAQQAGLRDKVVEINVTPNRGDVLSVRGVVRELVAALNCKTKDAFILNCNLYKNAAKNKAALKIKDNSRGNCQAFYGVIIKGVNCSTPSPQWLKRKLASIGCKNHSAVVDVTNLVLHEIGKPMHVYNLKKITGELQIAEAGQGKKMLGLDEKIYNLNPQTLVVLDEAGVVHGIAGILGAKESAVEGGICDILLESALFDKNCIATAGRQLQVFTDSRHRFERGVDPETLVESLEYAASLIMSICGSENVSEIFGFNNISHDNGQSNCKQISVSKESITNLLGTEIESAKIESILKKLGFKVTLDGSKFLVTPPSYRQDVETSVDVIEEVARCYGYNNIKLQPFLAASNFAWMNQSTFIEKCRSLLVKMGLQEIITYSFTNSKINDVFTSNGTTEGASECLAAGTIEIKNPISADLNCMRSNLLANMLQVVEQDNNYKIYAHHMFEIGKVFSVQNAAQGLAKVGQMGQGVCENLSLCILRCGEISSNFVHKNARVADIFDVKNDMLTVLESVFGYAKESFSIVPVSPVAKASDSNVPSNNGSSVGAIMYMHPHKCFHVMLGKTLVANFGEIHPNVSQNIKHPVNFAEIFLGNLPKERLHNGYTARRKIHDSALPVIVREMAFVVQDDVTAAHLEKAVRQSCKNSDKYRDSIVKINILDIFSDKRMSDEGKKSVALSVEIDQKDTTMSSTQLQEIMSLIKDSVLATCQGVLRDGKV